MAVDRGGLQYTITVVNGFSGPLRQFRSELTQARSAFLQFRRTAGGLSRTARSAGRSLDQIGRSADRAGRALDRQNRSSATRVTTLQSELNALQGVASAEAQANTARRASLSSIQQQNAALESQRRTLTRLRAAQTRVGASSTRAAAGVDRTARSAVRANAAFGGLLLTLRRLVTTLVFFEAARFAFEGISRLVGGTIEFAASLEQAELGVASLLTALGELEDAQGRVLKDTEALGAAQDISRSQLQQLRIEGLRTAATFDQLAETFQVAVAPGLQADLSLDQIRQFTILISQAATAIQVPQRQLAEEIRSILTATPRTGQTRIADALGLGGPEGREALRQAREAGTLIDLINKRFGAFRIASQQGLDTFAARISNAVDSLFLLSSTGAVGFLETLKDLFQDIQEAAVDVNETTNRLTIDPQLVSIFQTIFDALASGVDQVRDFFKEFELGASTFQALADFVAGFLRITFNLLAGVFAGAVRGARDITRILSVLFNFVRLLTGVNLLDESQVDRASQLLATFVRIFIAVRGSALLMAAFTTSLGAAVLLALSLAALFDSVEQNGQKLLDQFTGIENVSFEGVFEILDATLEASVDKAEARFRQLGLVVNNELEAAFSRVGLVINEAVGEALNTIIQGPVRTLIQNIAFLRDGFAGLRAVNDILDGLENTAAGETRRKREIEITNNLKEQNKLARERAEQEIKTADALLATARASRQAFEEAGGEGFQAAADQEVFEGLKQNALNAVEEIKRVFGELGLDINDSLRLGLESVGDSLGELGVSFGKAGNDAAEEFESLSRRIGRSLEDLASPQGVVNEFFGFLENAARRTTDLIADLIVDAFDPTTDTTAKERFIQFLRELAREAIRILLRIALAKAAALAFPGEEQGGGAAAGGGFASGGSVGGPAVSEFDRKARDAIFRFPVGFAAGGSIGATGNRLQGRAGAVRAVRPAGLDPRDTVPIWAQQGEWVIRKKSTQAYGSQVMDAINRGLIDPFALKALAGARPSVRRRSSRPRMGFQTGGSVSALPAASTGNQQQVVGAVVMADEQSMQRMLAGGRSAMLDFFSENSGTIKGILS